MPIDELIDFFNLFYTYVDKKRFHIITISNGSNNLPDLYEPLIFYTIGILTYLDRARWFDLQHRTHLKELQSDIMDIIKPYMIQRQYSPSELPMRRWEVIFWQFIYAHFSDYPSDILNNITNDLASIARNNSRQEFEKIAASSLIIHMPSFAETYATSPIGDSNQIVSRNRDDHIKSIYRIYNEVCSKSGINLFGINFYKSYLELLKKQVIHPMMTTGIN